ncbi:MAG TPA: bifunctional precorrin-2 dehydrogenase/sirohydrochlorin ferrochelatase, partial [Thermomicrobiales bacterium]|nr:bifunctional precorrin-2 dehydrogenase/sirohydrochlorin ferrochelatase [Thermomicrobiales bacterium]
MSDVVYPIALDLSGKRCLVVGGGVIADGKLDALLAAGARIVLVSPEVLPRIAAFAADGQIDWRPRPYEAADLDGAFLVIAATDDRAINAGVAAEARARGILVNAVDDIPNCDFFAVAIVRRGDLQLSISTNGRSPAFARWLRERLDREIPAEYGDLLAVLGDVRERLKASGPIPDYEAWRDAIDDDLLAALEAGEREAAGEWLFRRLEGARVAAVAAAELE